MEQICSAFSYWTPIEQRIPMSLQYSPSRKLSNRISHPRTQDLSREIETAQSKTLEKHPIYSTICSLGLVAQSVEQRIENPCVGGSIPPRATKNNQNHLRVVFVL